MYLISYKLIAVIITAPSHVDTTYSSDMVSYYNKLLKLDYVILTGFKIY